MASDLLSSVKKTEESLLRLKRGRRSGAAAATTTSSTGMTDDNKIRLQIYLDVQEFKNQARRRYVYFCCLTDFLLD